MKPAAWRRFDTLGLRLFLLMWATLVASHLASFAFTTSGWTGTGPERPMAAAPGSAGGPTAPVRADPRADARPGLRDAPPGGPPDRPGPDMQPFSGPSLQSPPPEMPPIRALPPADLPTGALGLDLLVRALVIALGAAIGARWLARPVRHLADAADALAQDLARPAPPTPLDERHGVAEVRRSAAIFNRMAQRLRAQFDARGLHLAAVSHDLRTPLTRLRMRLEGAPPALAEAAAADIREMNDLIDGTLEVLREQRDGAPPGPLQLRTLLQAALDDLAETGIVATLGPGPEQRVLARPVALRRMVDNLVGNAARHGGGHIRIGLETTADGGVCVHVDDDGPGIPPERLALLMQPWQRGPETTGRRGEGLGLAITADLAERDGARLTLTHRPEGGGRATLWLPIAPA